MCRHVCVWSLLLTLACASASWALPQQRPTFHPMMALYGREGAPRESAGREGTESDGTPPDRSHRRSTPRCFIWWANIAEELGALLTLKSEITCTTWSEIKLCFLYPPGDPHRPACCDGYPPKDPVEPPGE